MCRNTFPSGVNSCRFCQWKKIFTHYPKFKNTTNSIKWLLRLALFFYTNPQSICVSAWSQTRDLSCVSQMCKSLHCGVQLVNLIDIGLNCFKGALHPRSSFHVMFDDINFISVVSCCHPLCSGVMCPTPLSMYVHRRVCRCQKATLPDISTNENNNLFVPTSRLPAFSFKEAVF